MCEAIFIFFVVVDVITVNTKVGIDGLVGGFIVNVAVFDGAVVVDSVL